jgi:hypothetical protein
MVVSTRSCVHAHCQRALTHRPEEVMLVHSLQRIASPVENPYSRVYARTLSRKG